MSLSHPKVKEILFTGHCWEKQIQTPILLQCNPWCCCELNIYSHCAQNKLCNPFCPTIHAHRHAMMWTWRTGKQCYNKYQHFQKNITQILNVWESSQIKLKSKEKNMQNSSYLFSSVLKIKESTEILVKLRF